MKRGYSESPSSSSIGLPQSKFKHNPQGDTDFLEDESTKIFARKVADHYSARTNQTLEECEASPIIHLKKLNNWIKSVLIQLYAKRGDAVLDLACGKDKANVGYYVGIDIADGSDAVDCPEWIVPFHVFKALAEEYDFELVFVKNNHIFVEEYMKKPEFIELMRRLGALDDGNQDRRQPDQTRRNPRRDKSKMHLTEEDIENVNGAV
ncbi:hypothetical protein RND71_029435 [Anisodus tanguticus]|uniref:mRNA (guanine-N(7))-methyltransferase n=1 Tax=Anisodus tanguticus TaxID=243964 RepID=A0AAE1V073_9SOLA|nr:hypothetical protein RND71_029435 [Anisodus tanguticus]